MALKPVNPGLRPFWNKTNAVAKVSIAVPAGDQVMVSDEVAAQLGVAFAEGEAPAELGPNVATPPVAEMPAPTGEPAPMVTPYPTAEEAYPPESVVTLPPSKPKRVRKPKD